MLKSKVVIDQMGFEVLVPRTPMKIISLVPSQTELLFDLGLDNGIIGITKFCTHPNHFIKKKQIIGGTKQFRYDIIDTLKPDLIIGNKEENYKEGITTLKLKYPVWMSDVSTISDALSMITSIGDLVEKKEEAQGLVRKIKAGFNTIDPLPVITGKLLYLIWRKPYMAAANSTFIHEIMKTAGFTNVVAHLERYPELSSDVIHDLHPDYILLSSEPYPFIHKHIAELEQICPNAKILLIDGEMFSWYGSRLVHAGGYLNRLKKELNNYS